MNFEQTKTYIETHYNVIQYNNGHVKSIGKDAGIYKNPYWNVNENDKEIIYMVPVEDTTGNVLI